MHDTRREVIGGMGTRARRLVPQLVLVLLTSDI